MKIIIIGTGYVGLVSAACFAELGHEVACVDIQLEKIAQLRRDLIPIYEPGLKELVKKNRELGRLDYYTAVTEVPFVPDIYLLAVGTPSLADGSVDMQYIDAATRSIAQHLKDYVVIINKSTVPVGTTERVTDLVQQNNPQAKFDVVSNPEFLKEGSAVQDALKPDRVVIGATSSRALEVMRKLYQPMALSVEQYLEMLPREAEMTKYVANAMLATKISFMNEMANLCERFEVDVEQVKLAIGKDKRIGPAFINPGCGYGGSCFPKDIKALIQLAHQVEFKPQLLEAVESRNQAQKQVLSEKLSKAFKGELRGKTVALLGLAFKPGTDDLREASSIEFIRAVLPQGVKVKAYDPIAMPAAKSYFPKAWFAENQLVLVDSVDQAVAQADALIVVTEWPEFKALNLTPVSEKMTGNVLIDGRNIFDPMQVKALGFQYVGIGR